MTAIELMLFTGEWLLRILFLILIARPLARVTGVKILVKWRRQLGWAFGILTLVHILVYLFLYIDSLSFLLTVVDDLWFITGLAATIISFALALTSNNYSIRLLKKKWKTLHKLTYYVGFIGILHGEIASKQLNSELYVMLSLYTLLLLWRWRKWSMLALSIVVIFFSLGKIIGTQSTGTRPPPASIGITESPQAWQRCGQYGLDYWEDPTNGFYDCRRPTR